MAFSFFSKQCLAVLGAMACAALPALGQAQIVNYNEAIANYKDA